jgi:hypothetical protein
LEDLVLTLYVKLNEGIMLRRKPGKSMWDKLNDNWEPPKRSILNRVFTPVAESKIMEIIILLCIIMNTAILAIQVRPVAPRPE